VLKDVSTKGDAQEAYTQALLALWKENDKVVCMGYHTLMEQADEHAAKLRELTEFSYFSVLKNPKGKLTLKVVKDRLAATGDLAERAVLNAYMEAVAALKAKSKQAAEQFAEIETLYKAQLESEPLPVSFADFQVTVRCLELLEQQATLKGRVKEADAALDLLAYEKYAQLSVDEIKTLVVDDKWLARLATDLQGELERVGQTLSARIRELAERYATPLPQLVDEVAMLSARMEEHLKRMGAVWM